MSEEDIEWTQSQWPGMLLRIVTRDLSSGLEETVFKKVPAERDLEAAMEWAAREYHDPTRPQTPPTPEVAKAARDALYPPRR